MSNPENQFTIEAPSGPLTLQLERYPKQSKQKLQAWEAADIYLLNTALERGINSENNGKVLLLNDSFGAISCALHGLAPCSISDSWLAQQACRENLVLNQLPAHGIELRHSLDWPSQKVDWVLLKVPKSLALLEDQLQRLRPLLHSDTQIIAAAMSKHIHTNTLKLFERIIGPCQTSLAVKKSRLIHCQFEQGLDPAPNKYPSPYSIPHLQLNMLDHSGVFSQGKLDIGSRFFCEHIPSSSAQRTLVDLGCGNGLVGIVAGQKNPNAKLIFCDESHMATASARQNWQHNNQSQTAEFYTANGLDPLDDSSVDVVLNNPPFHQGNVIGDFIAQKMFNDAHRVLRSGGELWVVGNRHLGYHQVLKRVFGHCQLMESNKKFVILKACKR